MIEISVVNASTAVSADEAAAALPALQRQVSEDFAPAWGIDARLSLVPPRSKPAAGRWWLVILDDSDQQGALGYHDLTTTGLPLGKVFANTDEQTRHSWSVTASHELLEMLADPDIDLAAFVHDGARATRLYAYEVCDPVEGDDLGYEIDGIRVSDFVYPSWFQQFRAKDSTAFDHRHHLHEPFALAPGGYCSVFEVAGGEWRQVTRDGEPRLFARRLRVGSRRERRRLPRDEWMCSTVPVT